VDEAMEEVIKNIIHIDKSAARLREDIEKQIKDKKLHVDDEIERLRCEIVESKKDEIKSLEDSELSKAKADGEKITSAAVKKSNDMYEKFLNEKENLVKELFASIIEM
jgi:hypothetical protein